MTVILDSTALFHLNYHRNKIMPVLKEMGATKFCITRINYLEIMAGSSLKSKKETRKFLQQFSVIEFTPACKDVANTLAFKYEISSKNQHDFFNSEHCNS